MKTNIDDIILGLKKVRLMLCGYMSTINDDYWICDCKYGATDVGEQSGCPEILDAIDFLSQQKTEIDKQLEFDFYKSKNE